MEEKKIFGRTCPKCGEIYQFSGISKVGLGSGLQIDMGCGAGHRWSEFYNLNYQGYWCDNKKFNSYGEEETNV